MTILDLVEDEYYYVICFSNIVRAQYLGLNETSEGVFFSCPNISYIYPELRRYIYMEPWEIEHRVFKVTKELKAYVELFKVASQGIYTEFQEKTE